MDNTVEINHKSVEAIRRSFLKEGMKISSWKKVPDVCIQGGSNENFNTFPKSENK